MPTLATIPMTIDPAAAEFLAEIGQERELELMLDHARATIPHLRALDVVLHDFPETGAPSLTIDAHRDPYRGESDRAGLDFNLWVMERFPREVSKNFHLMVFSHDDER